MSPAASAQEDRTITTRTASGSSRHARRYRRAAVAAPLALGLVAAACGGSSSKVRSAAAVPPTAPVTTTTVPPTYPLTGLPATDAGRAGRPALSIKVDNVAGSFPQAGLNNADIVAEELVEGGLTRLFAVYQSQDAAQVGPIRSARPADAALLRLLNGGIFGYSGADAGEIAPVKQYSGSVLLSYDNGVPAFHKVAGRPSPHWVFAATGDLWKAGLAAGAKNAPPPAMFSYSPTAPAGTPATTAYMNMSNVSSNQWTWNGQHYLRVQNGSPDTLTDGSQVWADNVVVMSVGIGHTGNIDRAGNEDPLVELVDSGTVWVFRNGRMIQGTWQRPSMEGPMKLVDATGATIALQPGRTWVELLPRPNSPRVS